MNLLFLVGLFLSLMFVACLVGISLAGVAMLWDKYVGKKAPRIANGEGK
jgi:hypothetical protein